LLNKKIALIPSIFIGVVLFKKSGILIKVVGEIKLFQICMTITKLSFIKNTLNVNFSYTKIFFGIYTKDKLY